jgi:uncharacterized repeat protein (TIGR02059 family)
MATTKYFILPSSTGANFTDFDLSYGSVTLSGEQVTFVGSTQVDAVFVRPGVTVDFTLSGSGADKIYLGGSFASYTSSITGSVMTLQRGAGATLESVSFVKSTSALVSDSVIFADGTLNSLDLYNTLKNGTALPALVTTETSLAPFAPAAAGSVLNATIKAFALNSAGDTFAPAKPGVAMTVVGSVGVDTVYVPRGGVVDCTLLGSGQDMIYFTGNWGDYTKVISGSVVTFSRTVDGYSESIKVVGSTTNVSLNDRLVFADGAVYSGAAKTALTTSLTAAITAVTGYDATLTTPGLAPTLNASALNNVTNLEVGSNLVLNYSESVTAVAGKYIHIVNDGGTGFRGESTVNTLDILVTDASQVSISGGRVTLNPTADLDLANNYHITIDAGAFRGASSNQVSAAYNGTNFSTVTPGTTALANAAASRVMNTDGTLGNGHLWLDIEGIGSPSASAGTALDLSANNYTLVAKDYEAAGGSPGNDGVKTGDFYVAANNFGAGDVVYIDNQGGAANDLTQTNVINYGTPPTTVQFAGTGLGGLVDISLAGSTATFDTVTQLKSLLGASTDPIFSDSASGQVDVLPPTVVSGSYGANDGNLTVGEAITLTFGFSEAVTVTGTPSIALANGGTAVYASGSTTNALTFTYTPAAGQSTADLMTAAANALTGTIKDAAGNAVVVSGFNNLNPPGIVAVNVDVDVTAPTLSTAVAQGTTLTLTYSEALDPSHQPSARYFNLTPSSGAGRTITGMQVNGNAVLLQLSSALLPSTLATYTLRYGDPTAGNDAYAIQDLAGNDAAGYASQAVTVTAPSGSDTTAPTINGVTITTPSTVNLQFSEAVSFTNSTGLTLTNAATGAAIPYTLAAGATADSLVLTTSSALASTDVVTVSYNGTAGTIKDLANNTLGNATIMTGGDGVNTITATSGVTIRGNGGNDTITGSGSVDSIIAGGGADTVEAGYGADTVNLNEGTRSTDTVKLLGNGSTNSWTLGYDTINAFDVSNAGGTNNDVLNLPSGTIAADTGITPGVAVNGIAKYSIASGIISFYDASNNPVQITNTNKGFALSFLSTNLTQAGRTVGFALDSDGNGQSDSLMVFQDGVAVNGFGYSDIAAQLNGVNGVTLSNTAGQNVVQIVDTTSAGTVARYFSSGPDAVVTTVQGEDVFPKTIGTILDPEIYVNGTGADVRVGRITDGTNIIRQQTNATLSETDWLLYYGGSSTMDASGNYSGATYHSSVSVIGGSAANVIDVSLIDVSAVTGSTTFYANAGDDQITGTAVADQIWGGTGADIMSGGLGADQFRFMQGHSPMAAVNIGGDATLNAGDIFTFAGGKTDVVHGRFDVAGSGGDRIQLNSVANQFGLSSMGLAPTNGVVGNQQFYTVQGNYVNGSFTVNTAGGVDTLVVYDGDATAAVSQTALVVQGHAPAALTVSGNTLYATTADTDSTAPTLTAATVNGATLTLTFSEAIDSMHTPATNPVILVNGDLRAMASGSISGNTATLTLASPVVAGDVVSFSYADPTSGDDANALQDLVGNDIASGSNVPVTNNTPGSSDTTAPTLLSAVAQGTALTLTYSEALDPSHALSTSYFQVSASGTAAGRTIQTVQVTGSTVTLTFGNPLLPASSGTTYTLKYSDPSAGNDAYAIQDLAGNDAAGYVGQAITVNAVSGSDSTAPNISGAILTPGTLNAVVTLQFSEAVGFTDATGLTLTSSGGTPIPFTLAAGVTSDLLVLTTTATFASTDSVVVSYNSGTGSIKDLSASLNILGSTTMIIGGDGINAISASSATSGVVIRANGGSDAITGSSSNDTIFGGGGTDTIEAGFGADTITLNEGTRSTDTVKFLNNNNSWILGYDTINSFDVSNAGGTNNDVLNLPSGTIAADTSLTAGVAVNGITKHLIASGIISFYNASNAPILITNTNKADALNYLSLNITQAGRTVGFALDSDANGQPNSLVVFQDGVSVNGFGNSDIAAQLNGVVGVTLSNTAGQNVVQIQDTTAGNTLMRSFSSGANAVLTTTSSEDAVQYSGTITAPTILVNGIGGDVYLSSTMNGTNTHTAQTSATLTQADWLLYTSGLASMDNAGNSNAPGSISFIGGSGDNVINAGASNIGAVTSTNIYGYAGDDQITGTAVADQIYGGTGADIMSGGLGADRFRFTQGDSPLVTGNFGADNVLNTGDMFTFAGGKADVVHGRFDVAGSSGDRIQFNSVNVASPTYTTMPVNGLVTNQNFYMVQGYYDAFSGSFTVDTGSGVDTLVVYDGDQTSGVTQTALVVQQHTPTMLTASANNIYANAVDTDSTAPTIASASVNGLTLTINFSEVIDDPHSPNMPPVIMVNGVARAISDGAITGATATLTLAAPVVAGDVVTLSYTDPTSGDDANAIQDLTGNDMASVSNFSVTNGAVVDTTAPVLQSAVAQGTTLTLTYNEALDPAHQPSVSYFQIAATNSGAGRSISGMQITGSTVVLTLSSALFPATSGVSYTLKYSDPSAGNDAYAIQDLSGNDAAGYTAQAITVNAPTGADTTAPVILSAALTPGVGNASVTLQFSEPVSIYHATDLTLSSGSGAIAITGVTFNASADTAYLSTSATLAATDVVTLSYNSTLTPISDTAATPNVMGSTTLVIGGESANTITVNSGSTVRANGGADVITGSSSSDSLIAGGGADTIEGGNGADTIQLNEGTRATDTVMLLGSGQSVIPSYDTINSFDVSNAGGTNNDVLNLPSGVIAANVGMTAGTAVNAIAKYSITSGIATFYDVNGTPILINGTNKTSALNFLSLNLTQTGRTVGFAFDRDGNGQTDSLMVFQDAVSVNGFGLNDIAVQLNDVNGVTLSNTAGQNVVRIDDTTPLTSVMRSFTSGANAVLTSIQSEDMSAGSGTTHATMLVNGQGSDVWVSRSVAGNVLTTQTSATLAQTDWILYTSGNSVVDAANVATEAGNITAFGGSANNVINVSSITTTGPNGVININGYAGDDLIIGSATNDRISGGTGADLMFGGLGADRFRFAQGDSPLVTVMTGMDGTLNNGDTFSFVGGKADVVYGQFDVAGSNGDRIQLTSAANLAFMTSMTAPTNGMVTDQKFYTVRGNYDAGGGQFYVDSSFGLDTLIVYDGDSTAAVTQTALVVQGHAPGAFTVSGNTLYATTADTDFTPPTLTSASVNGLILTLNFSEIFDAAHINVDPVVSVNGVVRPFLDGFPLGSSAKLVLSSPVTASDTVTISYTDPTTGDDAYVLQDLAGNDLASISNFAVTNSTTSPANYLVGSSAADTLILSLTAATGFNPTTFVGGRGEDIGIDIAQIDVGNLAASFTGPLVMSQDAAQLSWHLLDSSATPKIIADITQQTSPTTQEPFPVYNVVLHNPSNSSSVTETLINMETLKLVNGSTALFAWDLNTHATIPV